MKNLQGFLFFRVRGGQLVIMLPKVLCSKIYGIDT